MKNWSMQSPSKSQLKAITHGSGPMLVLAGPGSGKTYVMVQRVLHLITHFHIDPQSILVISFSKASAQELKKRFDAQMGGRGKVNFSTFHACFFHILKTTFSYTSKSIITPAEQREIIKTLLLDPHYEQTDTREKEEEFISKFSYYKNREPEILREKESSKFWELFQAYQQEMHSRGKLDFDDMGLLCLKLFRERPEILTLWQDKFKFILIDEFQDINPIQFHIIQLLVQQTKNLFVVGDDDQAIYSFRGSSPRIMLNFEKIYPDTQRVLLETNYRCSENIIQKSLEVIGENKQRFYKEIKAYKLPGNPVILKGFPNYPAEYAYMIKRFKELFAEGVRPSEISCIYRTNQNMGGLAQYLIRHHIPFVMKEVGKSIFDHFIARDILSYLQFFLEGKRRSDFFIIMNKPLRYLSRKACRNETVEWEELKAYYREKPYMQNILSGLEKQESWISRLDLYGAVSYIRKAIGYEKYLEEYCKRQGLLLDEAEEILDFVHNSIRGMASLLQWKQEIAQYEEAIKQADGKEKEGIHLLTMHACKGLEYPHVFLPDCNEGKLPHKKAVTEEELEEERRMFYVAMTRAKDSLELLYIEDRSGRKSQPSRFLPLKRKGKGNILKKSL
ncbi:MAG: ATP-dependent helicase [Lachnospiraceae bacterium]